MRSRGYPSGRRSSIASFDLRRRLKQSKLVRCDGAALLDKVAPLCCERDSSVFVCAFLLGMMIAVGVFDGDDCGWSGTSNALKLMVTAS